MSALRCLACAAAFAASAAIPARAEPVAVNNALGQGIIFENRGNCYALMPAHVHPEGPFLNLFTAAPQAAGSGVVYFRRTEADFLLALVRGSAADRCTMRFSDFAADVSRLLSASATATLERVNPQGGLERLAMRIDRIGWAGASEAAGQAGGGGLFEYIHASTDSAAGETREVFQGTSGAFLYIGDTPVGMVVTAPDATSVRALRIEEMHDPLSRWFASGSFGALGAEPGSASATPEAAGLDFRVTEWTGQPVAAEYAPMGLQDGSAPFRAHPVGGAVSVTLEVSDGAPRGIAGLWLEGPVPGDPSQGTQGSGPASTPRSVLIEVDRSRRGPARFDEFASLEMIEGEAAQVPMNTFARRIRITIRSAWRPDLPVEISRVTVQPTP